MKKIIMSLGKHNQQLLIALIYILLFSFGGVMASSFSQTTFPEENIGDDFSFLDVPEAHWAFDSIYKLRLFGVTEGIGNNQFGLGLTITKGEFITFLARLMKWDLIDPEKGSFLDNMDTSKWYYSPIETALKHGAILNDIEKIMPNKPITREEMAIMIVRTLGYETLVRQLIPHDNPFEDVYSNIEYITVAKDFGIIKGVGNNMFKPFATATREEAAVMMMRMHEKLNAGINELHAFYAIRSAEQMDMIKSLNSVAFGWSRLEYDVKTGRVFINITEANNNEYSIPDGFLRPLHQARESNVLTQLMVYASNDILINVDPETPIPMLEYLLTNPDIRTQTISEIVKYVNNTVKGDSVVSFDGVVVDFENMKGQSLKTAFIDFLKELRTALDKHGNLLYVTVHPQMSPGQEYFDGYDYKAIGEIADKIILMAHDYSAKKLNDSEMESGYTITPLTPIKEIYYALKYITDVSTGVQDLDKIWFQISFDSAQWKLKDNRVINSYPYRPDYESIKLRLLKDVIINYSEIYQNPYVSFYNEKDNTHNILWYEDSRSVNAKLKLAKMFGINGISLWRLGNIPAYGNNIGKKIYLDIWQSLR